MEILLVLWKCKTALLTWQNKLHVNVSKWHWNTLRRSTVLDSLQGWEKSRVSTWARLTQPMLTVVTNSIRHLDKRHSSKVVNDSISNFEGSVLLCIEADLRDQIRVGKRLTRSTWRPCISKMDEGKDGTHWKRKGKKKDLQIPQCHSSFFFSRP